MAQMISQDFLASVLSESEIQNQVLDYLELSGFLAIRINSGLFLQSRNRVFRAYIIKNNGSSSGFPDVLALKNNHFILFEIKAAKGIISKSQKEFSKLAQEKHISVYVVNSLENAIKYINLEQKLWQDQ